MNLVKFPDDSDHDFQMVAGRLDLMCKEAEKKVAQNWEDWEK